MHESYMCMAQLARCTSPRARTASVKRQPLVASVPGLYCDGFRSADFSLCHLPDKGFVVLEQWGEVFSEEAMLNYSLCTFVFTTFFRKHSYYILEHIATRVKGLKGIIS